MTDKAFGDLIAKVVRQMLQKDIPVAQSGILDQLDEIGKAYVARGEANRSLIDWLGALCQRLDDWNVPRKTDDGHILTPMDRVACLATERDQYKQQLELARTEAPNVSLLCDAINKLSPIALARAYEIWVLEYEQPFAGDATEYVVFRDGFCVRHGKEFLNPKGVDPDWVATRISCTPEDLTSGWCKLEGEEFVQALATWWA